MKVEKIKLSAVIDSITEKLQEAIKAKKQGVSYMYICGTKILTVSVESIEDDTAKKEETVDVKTETDSTTVEVK